MNLSIKAAKQLGERLAVSLHHAGRDTVKRGAILDVRGDIESTITKSDTRIAFRESYFNTLDVLEPLPSGRKWNP